MRRREWWAIAIMLLVTLMLLWTASLLSCTIDAKLDDEIHIVVPPPKPQKVD